MFQSLNDLRETTVVTSEGEVGKIHDFIFHDHDWVVRYAIVDLTDDRRYVLTIPDAFDRIDRGSGQVSVSLSKEMLHHSPDFRPDQPISRAFEIEVHDYFQWPSYWEDDKVIPMTGPNDLTGVPLAEMEIDLEQQQDEMAQSEEEYYDNLKTLSTVLKYRLRTRDGQELGHLDDLIAQDDDWKIMYAVVALGGLLPSRRVIVSPSLMEEFDHQLGEIIVSLKAETIQDSPEYTPEKLTDENYDWDRHTK